MQTPYHTMTVILAVFVATLSPAQQSAQGGEDAIQIKDSAADLIRSASVGHERLVLTLNRPDAYLHLRVSGDIPIARQIPILRDMLHSLPLGTHDQPAVSGMFVGRLIDYPDLATRLALAAATSDQWNASNTSRYHAMAADIAESYGVFEEWRALFAEFGWRLRVSRMEKVLVSTPSDLIPFGKALIDQGIPPDTALPFDALTYFSVQPISKEP